MYKDSVTQLAADSNQLIRFYVTQPALAEARIIAGRWPEAKDRAMRAADTVEAGNVTRLRRNIYRVVDLDTEEAHLVTFSTFDDTGGYACTCGDWFSALLDHPGAAPYPKDWSGCSPMCVHTLAVEIGTRIEAIEDAEIPF
jgi:hypothetical protein